MHDLSYQLASNSGNVLAPLDLSQNTIDFCATRPMILHKQLKKIFVEFKFRLDSSDHFNSSLRRFPKFCVAVLTRESVSQVR